MRTFSRVLFTSFFLCSFLSHAADNRALKAMQNDRVSSGKRVALVIGNGNYQHSDSLPKLANPTHDAEDIAKALRGFGFEVIEKKNLSLEEMSEAISEFGRKITDSEAALFYFAGHGLQVKGQNYLVPVNAKIDSEARVPYQAINVNQLLDEMDNSKSHANIVMLDACRNNPISGKFRSGSTRGLAAPTSQPKGTVIVYATDPGNVAADGNGRNGLFTAGLLTAFKGGDLSLHGVLVRASREVEKGSEKKQTPYINGPATLQEEFLFAASKQEIISNETKNITAISVVDSKPFVPAVKGNASERITSEQTTNAAAYYLSIGSFRDEDDAKRLNAKLALLGIEALIKIIAIPDKGTFYRNVSGPYHSTEDLNKAQAIMKQQGLNSTPIVDGAPMSASSSGLASGHTNDSKSSLGKGVLLLNTTPSKAKVYIDGIYFGRSPMSVEIEAGVHEVKVATDGYKSTLTNSLINFENGAPVQLNLTLER
ncbi:MAG: caspase family protein [Gallionellaceae bacterium]